MTDRTGRELLFGTTSYVLPDDILPNARLLAGLVDDIELILFEGDASNLPSPVEIEELRRLGAEEGCGYTVHLPLDVGLGEDDVVIRKRAVEICRRVIALTRPLAPRAFVAHPELPLRYHPALGEEPEQLPAPPPELAGLWPEAFGESLEALLTEAGPIPLAVENLMYPYEWVWSAVAPVPARVTLDVGHLVKSGGAVPDFLEAYGSRLSVVHLHGIVDGKDHRTAGAWGVEGLREFFDGFRRSGAGAEDAPLVVSLEVFGQEPTIASLRAVAEALGPEDPERATRLSLAAEKIEEAARGYGT